MPRSVLESLIEKDDKTIKFPPVSPIQNRFAQKMAIKISMLRLDEIHPVISGNKLFKLHYFLEEALASKHKTILTFGGAYSNHLAATAYACRVFNLTCIGIVRGERPAVPSDTLAFCEGQGMVLEFISRNDYKKNAGLQENAILKEKYGDYVVIPEGGFSEKGMLGASEIAGFYSGNNYSHICVAIGTATTVAGILRNSAQEVNVIGFPALKGMSDISERLHKLGINNQDNLSIINDYHFGGFGKKTPELIHFINQFYQENKIPLDFVYTGKMMFGIQDLLKKKYFPAGSDILCIHTGGLQGNSSIKEMLIY